MELFLRVIQGAYAYLLICLILIVSGLFLSLLWLIVRRTKEATGLSPYTAVGPSAVITAPVNDPITAAQVTPEELSLLESENAKLKNKIEILETDLKTQAGGVDRSKELNEKVQYLESKLLEYEILQEEIGTLSSLKIENEQLKQKLVASGVSASDSGSGLVSVAAPPVFIQVTPEPDPESSSSSQNEAPMVVKMAAPPPSPSLPNESDNLDALLAEIDKLTADKSPSP